MTALRKILVIAGTREAHHVLRALVAQGQDVVATLPELDRSAPALPLPVVPRRFVDAQGFADWIAAQKPTHIIDAGHPFEAEMSNTAARYCAHHAIGYLRLLRPAWTAGPDDRWTYVNSVAEASAQVPEGAIVLTNTGRRTQHAFAQFRGQRLYLRRLSPTSEAPAFAFMQYLVGPAPFTVSEERNLFVRLQLDHLITRNVGGQASVSKLVAAREIGLPVIMINRPPPPPNAPVVETAGEALSWESIA